MLHGTARYKSGPPSQQRVRSEAGSRLITGLLPAADLLPQGAVSFQPLLELRLESLSLGIVETRPLKGFGQAVEPSDPFLRMGGVDVAVPISHVLHQPGRSVPDDLGDRVGGALFDGPPGGLVAFVD